MTLAQLYASWHDTLKGSRWKTAEAHRWYICDMPFRICGRTLTLGAQGWDVPMPTLLSWRDELALVDGRRGGKLSPGYRTNIRATLTSCFSFHVAARAIDRHPMVGLPGDEPYDNNRQGYFTPVDIGPFLAHARPILRDMYMTSARCGGMRASEVLSIGRHNMDHASKEFVLVQKGGKKKRVLAADDIWAMCCDRLRVSGGWHVFPSIMDPSRPVPYSTLASWVTEAATASGVVLLGEKPVFHHARHTWVMAMLEAGMPLHWIAAQLGHRDTKQLEKRYGALRGAAKESARQMVNSSKLMVACSS